MQPEPTDYLSLVMKHDEPKCGRTRATSSIWQLPFKLKQETIGL
jgi:hypothetical protein